MEPSLRGPRMTRRVAAATLMALALLAAGCGGGSPPPPYDGEADPAALVPAGVAAYGVVDGAPRGALRGNAEQLISRVTRRPDARAVVREIATSVVAHTSGFRYDRDLEPWLGRRLAFFAVVTGGQVRGGGVFAVKDPARALAFELRNLREDGSSPIRLSYHGIAVVRSPSGRSWAAVIGQFLLDGEPAAVRAVIDGRRSGSLRASPGFQRALATLPPQRVATVFANPAVILSPRAAAELGTAVGRRRLAALEQPVAGALTVDRGSIGFDLATRSSGGARRLLARLPDDAYLAIAVGDLGGTIRGAIAAARALGASARVDALERAIRRFAGLDIERDLGWMGDAAAYYAGSGDTDDRLAVRILTRRAGPALRAVLLVAGALGRRARVTPLRLPGLGAGFRLLTTGGSRIEVVSGHGSVTGVLGRGGVAGEAGHRRTLSETAAYATARHILDGPPILLTTMPDLVRFVQRIGSLRVTNSSRAANTFAYLSRLGVVAAGVARTAGGRIDRIAIQVP